MSNLVTIPELEFGLMMIGWKNCDPLEVVEVVKLEDDKGVFYVPTVSDYVGDGSQRYTTGNPNGYTKREQACRCIGRCWDKAETEINNRILEDKQKNKEYWQAKTM